MSMNKEAEAFGISNRASSPPLYNNHLAGTMQPSFTGGQQFYTAPMSPTARMSQLPPMQNGVRPVSQFGMVQPGANFHATLPSGFAGNTQPGIQAPMNVAPNFQPANLQYPIIMQPPVFVQQQPSVQASNAAQIGEQYRAQQFALCAAGNHERRSKYGMLGIVCAIVFFPIGFLCMFADVEETCTRCGKCL